MINDFNRKIIHVDMDAFYASVEERDNSKLKKYPLIISRNPQKTGGKGVVATANYIARSRGVHSAMSADKALQLCPDAIFIKPNFKKYRENSEKIHNIFKKYTDYIESVALDEVYLDVSKNKFDYDSSVQLAHDLQKEIWEKVKLTCSVGISYNKFLAKLASDYAKPVGNTIILPGDAENFLSKLSISRFRGVGKKTIPKMHKLGVYTGADLLEQSESNLIKNFGKLGHILYNQVRGIDNSPIKWNVDRKSIGHERTFDKFLNGDQILLQLKLIAQDLSDQLNKEEKHGRTLVIKVRDSKFNTYTKRFTNEDYYKNSSDIIFNVAKDLFSKIPVHSNIRLLGITMTSLAPLNYENVSLDLFSFSSHKAF